MCFFGFIFHNLKNKVLTQSQLKEIGIQDLLDSGTISVVMQKEYKDMKVEIEAQNESLPEYNSADYPKYLPGFIKKDLYEAKIDEERIDSYDDYVNKIVTSADFDYETEGEKGLSTTIDFVPFVGQGKMALEAVLGIDLVSGRHLSKEEQLLILGTMGLGSIVEDGYKGIKAGMASEAEQTTSKTVLSMGIGGSSGEIEKLMKSATEKILSKRKAMLETEEAIAKVEGEDAINAALKDADIAAEVSEGAGKAEISKVDSKALEHSNKGEFTYSPKTGDVSKMKGGGHGQANIDFLEENGLEYEIVDTYPNGVRIGNVADHKTKVKRTGTNQAWFPESWSEQDILDAGEYVGNLKENINAVDGIGSFGEVNGVRVGVIRTDGEIATVFPDATMQP